MWNVGARPSREVDRGRHDLCGFAAIPHLYERTFHTHRLAIFDPARLAMVARDGCGA